MIQWWRRRRLRRIATPDGKPVGSGWPYPKPPAFTPTAVNDAAARQRVDQVVAGLIPHAFDEATGHVPMNLINTWADQWTDQVDSEFESYRHRVKQEIGLAAAALTELDSLHEADVRRVLELDAVRRHVFGELTDSGATATPEADLPGRGLDDADAGGPSPTSAKPDATYRAPGLVAGRSLTAKAHFVVLLVSALADFGAFAQIVQLVLTNQPALVSYLVVLGLTTGVLYLAHAVGTMVRDRVARRNAARWVWIMLGTTAWAAIGLVAFWVRLKVTDDQGQAPTIDLSAAPDTPPATPNTSGLPAALLFLALFIGTGLVAAIGAYLTHNPFPGEYRTAVRRYGAAVRSEGETDGVRIAVVRRLRHLRRALRKARSLRTRERRRRRHFAEELKEYARTLMANHAQDPAFSDALFDKERLPYHSINGHRSHPTNTSGAQE